MGLLSSLRTSDTLSGKQHTLYSLVGGSSAFDEDDELLKKHFGDHHAPPAKVVRSKKDAAASRKAPGVVLEEEEVGQQEQQDDRLLLQKVELSSVLPGRTTYGDQDHHGGAGRERPTLAAATLAGMKQNLLPGLILQVIGATVVAAYYLYDPARGWFDVLAGFKERTGYLFSMVSTAFFGGVLPFLIMLLKDHLGKRRRQKNRLMDYRDDDDEEASQGRFVEGEYIVVDEDGDEREPSVRLRVAQFCFYAGYLGYKGVETDAFYRLQGYVFGEGTDLWTIFIKVVVDQFIWNPIYAAPSNTIAFMWKDCDFSFSRLREELGWDFITFRVPSVLCSTWMVWVPAVSLIYALPSPLQIPLFNLVLCFFILLLSFVSKNTKS